MNTPNLALPLMSASQAQKHVTANETFLGLDALAQASAIDKDSATPPTSPSDGDTYIVGPSPNGDWAGNAGAIAYYFNGDWYLYPAQDGWICFVRDESRFYAYDSGWVLLSTLL